MYSDPHQNLFSLINPLDLRCQPVKQETLQGIVLLPYSSLTLNNSDKIPFKIGSSGELILAHLNYANLIQRDDEHNSIKKTVCEPSFPDNPDALLNKKLKDIKNEMTNDSNMENSFTNNVDEYIIFLNHFKKQRTHWRLYQSQITNSLYQYNNFPKLSQSYLSRLEKLNVTYRSAQNVISHLKIWLKNSEELVGLYTKKNSINELEILSLDSENLSRFHDYLLNHSQYMSDCDKKCSQIKYNNHILQRKKRTVFTKSIFQKLITIFKINQFPKSEDIQYLATNYKINQESIMQWFSNQRRKLHKDPKI